MNKFKTFTEFLTTQSAQVPVGGFVLNLLLSAILAAILSLLYIRFGKSLSNRKAFARNFVLITTTTMLIITIVKSSLALSLGLVGALSIVRFRTALKEPEELSFLFLAIAIGLGFGADQRLITTIGFLLIAIGIVVRNYSRRPEKHANLHFTVSSSTPRDTLLEDVAKVLRDSCTAVNMKRFDETRQGVEATFLVEFENFQKLITAKNALKSIDQSLSFTFLDNRGIL